MNQLNLFQQVEDLPVFSGVPDVPIEHANKILAALPESKRVSRLRRMYSGPEDTSGRVFREAMACDTPEARLARVGPQALTLLELIAIVLDVQTQPVTAARVLAEHRSLAAIRVLSVTELAASARLTFKQAKRLTCALELSERLREPMAEQCSIKSPADAADLLRDMNVLDQEQMRVIVVNTKNRVIEIATIYKGSVHTTVIRVGEVLRAAVKCNAAAFILAHNHPSGDPTPSPEDVAVTSEIVKAAKLLDIDLLDHIVIGGAGRYVSLKERGLGF